MNYLTAIIAVPLFLAIWAFEAYLFAKGKIHKQHNLKAKACMVVSTLQMVSCWFWLFGFVFSKTNSVLSEALEEDEEMNCFGLVGAEVLLSIFQWIFTLITLAVCLTMRRIARSASRLDSKAMTLSDGDKGVITVFGFFLAVYTVLAWNTAINRRCPQNEWQMLPGFQHHFYPVYLLFDAVFSLETMRMVNAILGAATTAQVVPTGEKSGEKRPASALKRSGTVRSFATFFRLQCKITLAGTLFAAGIFVLQFMADIRELSLIACVFCVCMYVTYALRRVPMLAKWVNFDLQKREFTSSRAPGATTQGKQGTNASAGTGTATSAVGSVAAPSILA